MGPAGATGRAPAALIRTESIDFDEAWAAQRALAAARRAREIPDVVWLLEHPPTFTTGRHGQREDLHLSDEAIADLGARFLAVDRGGQMTWHGPSQSVGYVIADLRPRRRVRRFVEALVGAMSDAAGLPDATPGARATGLYVRGRKLGSVGIRVSDGITTHGLALNRAPDLAWFGLMTACGAPGVPATSIAAEGGDPARERVEPALADGLAARLGLRLAGASLRDLLWRSGHPLERLLAESRGRIARLEPGGAAASCARGGLIVDIRDSGDRRRHGVVPGALAIPRNVLEWRTAPDSRHRHPVIAAVRGDLILMCADGYQSSLAAGTLHGLGCQRVADIVGGFAAWAACGLPVSRLT